MKYFGTDGDYHFEIVDDLQFPNLEDRMNYLAQFERRLWADGEIVEHLWTRTSESYSTI